MGQFECWWMPLVSTYYIACLSLDSIMTDNVMSSNGFARSKQKPVAAPRLIIIYNN